MVVWVGGHRKMPAFYLQASVVPLKQLYFADTTLAENFRPVDNPVTIRTVRPRAMQFIPLTAPEQAIGSTQQFVSLSPRGTSGERAGERGIPHKSASSPRPSPPGEGGEGGEGEETMRRDHKGELSAWPISFIFFRPDRPFGFAFVRWPSSIAAYRSVW